MVNTDDFIKRLEQLLEYYSLSASLFADKLGIQRSGLSHLMSGRNKPSLDFVMKIVENFPEVDLYWLLNGKGSFPKSDSPLEPIQKPAPTPAPPVAINSPKPQEALNLFTENSESKEVQQDDQAIPNSIPMPLNDGSIDRIVVFYSNGTFESYTARH